MELVKAKDTLMLDRDTWSYDCECMPCLHVVRLIHLRFIKPFRNFHIFFYFALPISSSSGAVFFKKVGCHDSPWLPILSQSHEVFVSHSRPFFDVFHPSGSYFPLQWTLQYQPVDVVAYIILQIHTFQIS